MTIHPTNEEARNRQDRLLTAAQRRRKLQGARLVRPARPRVLARSRQWLGAGLVRLGRALAGPAAGPDWRPACEPFSR